MEKLQKSMNIYMKAISKRAEIEDKEKTLPVAHLGGTMISHGEDFELDSEFGQCMTGELITLCYRCLLSITDHTPYSLWEDARANSSCSRKLHRRRYSQLA
jgi:hypothetical protein